jgi:hypothetical protein
MKLNSLLLLILASSSCFAQSARDYFFPASGKNVSVFVKPAKKGFLKVKEKTLVYFQDMGDSALITTIYPNHKGKLGWKEEMVKIEGTKISLLKIKSNIYRPQTFEADEVTLLKVPAEGSSYSEHVKGSTKQIYRAEFLTIKIDSKERKALKITQSSEMKRSGKKLMSYSDYYVQGLGYYKRTVDDGVAIEMLEEQKYDPNPPTMK